MQKRTRIAAVNHAAPRYQWLAIGLSMLASAAVVVQALLLSHIISQVFLAHTGLAEVIPLLLITLLLALLRAALVWCSEMSAQRVASLVKRTLRAQLSEQILALGPAFTRGERSGELSNTQSAGVEALDEYLSQYLPQMYLSVLVPVLVLLVVFPLDLLSGIVLLLTAPIIPLFMILVGGMAKQHTERQWHDLSRMSAHFLDVLQGLTTLKMLGRSREQAISIGRISARFGYVTMQVLRVAFLSSLVLELVASLSTAVVAVEIGLRLLHGGIGFEQALAVLLLAPEFYMPLRLLGARYHASMSGSEAIKRIEEVLAISPRVEDMAGQLAQRHMPGMPARFTIGFDDVHVSYDGVHAALNGLTLTIGHGERVALVGPSGAGKSTVVQLLLRFIDADSGAITVDGQPLSSFDRAAWRSQIAWVPQRPYLFHTTVAENIGLAQPNADIGQIIAAARAAEADEFIRRLPHGYQTVIGEHGMRLSGGQQQRLALARAFLKNTPLLILDEATAQLDAEQAANIHGALVRLMRGRTVLLITHHLQSVYAADRIILIEHGQATPLSDDSDRAGQLVATHS